MCVICNKVSGGQGVRINQQPSQVRVISCAEASNACSKSGNINSSECTTYKNDCLIAGNTSRVRLLF